MIADMTTLSSGSVSSRSTTSDKQKANLDYSSFLRLFVASMKNQDPTKPNDPAQTLSQLAAFSNVEQSIKLNDKLDRLVASSTASVAASMVGRDVTDLDGTLSGRVAAVESGPTGLFAILQDGRKLDLSKGYKFVSP
jgi:flagellar basal-body rod modification protein FlgD